MKGERKDTRRRKDKGKVEVGRRGRGFVKGCMHCVHICSGGGREEGEKRRSWGWERRGNKEEERGKEGREE